MLDVRLTKLNGITLSYAVTSSSIGHNVGLYNVPR